MLEVPIILRFVFLILLYLSLGLMIISFLEFKKKLDLLTTLILTLSFGVLFSLYLMDLLHNVLTALCNITICVSIPLTRLFIFSLVINAIVIVFRINKLTRISDFLSYVKKHLLISYLILGCLLVILVMISTTISSYSTAPITDTALFLVQARSLLHHGRIVSSVLHPEIPNYYSLSPPHIYVPFYYAQFMSVFGRSYEAAKMANLFIGLLAVMMLYCLSAMYHSNKAGLLAVSLVLLTPKLWPFLAFPFSGSEIVATFEMLTLLLLLRCLNFEIIDKRNFANYFIIAFLSYSILRTRIEYFAIFVTIFIAWHFASHYNGNMLRKAGTFLTTFFTCVIYLVTLRLKMYTVSVIILLLLAMSLIVLHLLHFKKIETAPLLIIAFLCLLSAQFMIVLHTNQQTTTSMIRLVEQKSFTGVITQTIARMGSYSFSESIERLRIFSGHLVNAFSVTFWGVFFLGAVIYAVDKKSKKSLLHFYPLVLCITLYMYYISVSGIDYPQGFNKHRFFLLSYFLLIFIQSIFIDNIFSKALTIIRRSHNLKLSPLCKRFYSFITTSFIVLLFLLPVISYDAMQQLKIAEESSIVAQKMNFVPHLQEAYSWIKNNTSYDVVILARKPCEVSWYTERKAIYIPLLPNDYASFKKTLREYNVSFLIVESHLCSSLKMNKIIIELCRGEYPSFLQPVLNYTYESSKVFIYRVLYS